MVIKKVKKVIRKKKALDGMDRAILRSIHNTQRNLSGRQIAKKVNLSPSAISPRLNNLKSQGIIRKNKVLGVRTFNRTFKIKGIKKPVTRRIRAPRSILWEINLRTKRKPKTERK